MDNFGAGFLFGNVDKEGRLESDDVFDDDEKKHLSGLSSIAVGGVIDEYNKESAKLIKGDEHGYDMVPPSPKAVDYSAISDDELDFDSSPAPPSASPGATPKKERKEDEENSQDDSMMDIILPTISKEDIILPSMTESETGSEQKLDSSELDSDVAKKRDKKKRHKEYTEQERLFKRTEKLIKKKINAAELNELFPTFEPSKPLRFLTLFEHTQTNGYPNPYRWMTNVRRRHNKDKRSSVSTEPKTVAFASPAPKAEWGPDEEETSLKELSWCVEAEIAEEEEKEEKPKKIPNWRNGPAKLWYDILSVPEDGAGFHYGFKLKPELQKEFDDMDEAEREKRIELDNEDKFNYNIWSNLKDEIPLYCQVQWEDDIIWTSEDSKNKKPSTGVRVDKEKLAGWVPNGRSREKRNEEGTNTFKVDEVTQKSIFPIDNYELIYGDWERKIIWDSQNMDFLPKPRDFKVNPNDDKLILNLPDDPEPRVELKAKETKNKRQIFQKSKEVLRNVGIGQNKDDGRNNEYIKSVDDEIVPNLRPEKDIWNLSNDEFYESKTKTEKTRGSLHALLQHSTPAIELQMPFFPTHMEPAKLRKFHRPPFNTNELPTGMSIQVKSCNKHNHQAERSREQERQATGGGEVFFMRKKADLSSKDAEVILAEYVEEYPPLFNQTGMASIIKIWRRRTCRDKPMDRKYDYGEPAYYTTSPFLGHVNNEASQAAFENQMFRSPIYFHKTAPTDFLLIRDAHSDQLSIRAVPETFLLGQQCPLIDVPGPNSKKHTNFLKDFLMVYLYRLFLQSTENPKKIRMDEVRKAFPTQSEGSIRKRLKSCAEFKRTGIDSNWWVLSPEFRLPTEEETRSLVKPEETCAFYSMLSAQQNLKDAGYREKSLLLDDKDEDDDPSKIDVEIQCAPWHTTRAFLSAMKNKCLLDITGQADPTGPAREGFSYIKIPNKPAQAEGEPNKPPQRKQLVTGTDADLRRLNLKQAKEMLKKWGFKEANIDKLSRWEVIDVVRSMSTRQAREGDGSFGKFARGNRFSAAEHHDRYKEECQQRFDLQNRQLANEQPLSTDDSSSDDDDEDFNKMEKNLDAIFNNRKTTAQIQEEREERERKELIASMVGNSDSNKQEKKETKAEKVAEKDVSQMEIDGKQLIIKRVFIDEQGIKQEKEEIIKKPGVIEAYLKIKYSKADKDALKRYLAENSDEEKEKAENLRRERRRLQELQRRIAKNKSKEEKKIRQYTDKLDKDRSDTDDNEVWKDRNDGLVKNDGTKLILSKKALTGAGTGSSHHHLSTTSATSASAAKRARQVSSDQDFSSDQASEITMPRKKKKEVAYVGEEKRGRGRPRKKRSANEGDYLLQRPTQKRERLRADPLVSISSSFEKTLTDLRTDAFDIMEPFSKPVDKRDVIDYYDIIANPMSIQCIRDKLREHKYQTRDVFLEDIDLIFTNCRDYNGIHSPFTDKAQEMVAFVRERVEKDREKLIKLERKINPLLDDNSQNKMSFILSNIVTEKLWNVEGGAYFQAPVDRKRYKDYAAIIVKPMDLKTIKKNITRHTYRTCDHFRGDMRLIHENSLKYNGENHECTKAAANLVATMETALEAESDELKKLEILIVTTQTQVNSDSNFLDDLKMSDEDEDEMENEADNEGGEMEDQSQESLDPEEMDSFTRDSIPVMEQDHDHHQPETPQGYPEGSSALEGLDLSESEDEHTDLQAAFEGPADLFGNITSSDEE